MFRPGIRFSILVVFFVALLGLLSGSSAVAQEGTPPPGGFEIAPGVTALALAYAEGQEEPSLYSLTFAPGVIYPFTGDPSLVIVYVESGSLTLRVSAPVTIGRLGATDAAGGNVAAGTEFAVEAGDYFTLAPDVTGEVRNDGADPASVTVAGFIPPGVEATPIAGTPTS